MEITMRIFSGRTSHEKNEPQKKAACFSKQETVNS